MQADCAWHCQCQGAALCDCRAGTCYLQRQRDQPFCPRGRSCAPAEYGHQWGRLHCEAAFFPTQMPWVSGGPDMQGYSSLQPGQTVWRMCHLNFHQPCAISGQSVAKGVAHLHYRFPTCVSQHGRPGAALPVEPAPSVYKTAYMSMQNLHIDWTCVGLRYGLLHGDCTIRKKFTRCNMRPMH